MDQKLLAFAVAGLDVTIPEGVKLKWQGREIDSGPLTITLGASGSGGLIDYETGKVDVEFRIRIMFPELAEILDEMGTDPGLTAAIEGVVRSQGSVFDNDHSLRLSGKAVLAEHRLFDPAETKIEILAPTH
jgi:hypothetical protein